MEETEEIALSVAKRNAVERFGVYVESETKVEDYQLVKDEITTLSAGVVRIKDGSKNIDRDMNEDGMIVVKAEAVFILDRDDLEKRLEKYVERESEDVDELVARINELEEEISDYSQREDVSSEELKSSLAERDESIEELDNALDFAGEEFIFDIEDERISRLKRVKEYLEGLREIADPYQAFEFEITDQPEIKDQGAGKVELTLSKSIKVDRSYHGKALRLLEEYEDALYPNDGEMDNINEKVLGSSLEERRIMLPTYVTFLNAQNEVVAFYSRSSDRFFFELHSPYSHDTIFSTQIFYQGRSSYNIPRNNDEVEYELTGELPERIVSEIEKIKVVVGNQDRNDLTRDHNYEGYDGYSYIYSYLPLNLSDFMLTEDDILEKIDRKILNVEEKINELKGEEEKDEAEFDLGSSDEKNQEDDKEVKDSKEFDSKDKVKEDKTGALLKGSYSPLSINGEYDLSNNYNVGATLNIPFKILAQESGSLFFDMLANNSRFAEFAFNYYNIDQDTSGKGIDFAFGDRFGIISNRLEGYYKLGLGFTSFGQDDYKLDEDKFKDLKSIGFNLNSGLGVNLNINKIALYSEINLRNFLTSDWYYEDANETVDIEDEELGFFIDNPVLKVGIGITF